MTRGLLTGCGRRARADGRAHVATSPRSAARSCSPLLPPTPLRSTLRWRFRGRCGPPCSGTGIEVHTILPGFVTTPGFPHPKFFATRLGRLFVVGPDHVAKKVLSAVEQGKAEIVVPWFPYRLRLDRTGDAADAHGTSAPERGVRRRAIAAPSAMSRYRASHLMGRGRHASLRHTSRSPPRTPRRGPCR